MNQLAVIQDEVYAVQAQFESMNSDRNIVFAKEAEFAMQIMEGNSTLAGIAFSNRPSIRAAILNVAGIGLSLNPARKQAYLVPRKVNKQMAACLDISYRGLMDLATTSGSVAWAQAKLVYRNDRFMVRGYGEAPLHEFDAFGERGEWVGAYCVAKTMDGSFMVEHMSRDEIYAIRDRSDAWKAYLGKKIFSCPWSTDEGEMAKKTVIKRASKSWPNTARLDNAVHYLNTEAGEGFVDLADVSMGEPSPTAGQTPFSEQDQLLQSIKAANNPVELKAAKQKAQSFASQRKDRSLYDKVTEAAKAVAARLRDAAGVTDVESRMA